MKEKETSGRGCLTWLTVGEVVPQACDTDLNNVSSLPKRAQRKGG